MYEAAVGFWGSPRPAISPFCATSIGASSAHSLVWACRIVSCSLLRRSFAEAPLRRRWLPLLRTSRAIAVGPSLHTDGRGRGSGCACAPPATKTVRPLRPRRPNTSHSGIDWRRRIGALGLCAWPANVRSSAGGRVTWPRPTAPHNACQYRKCHRSGIPVLQRHPCGCAAPGLSRKHGHGWPRSAPAQLPPITSRLSPGDGGHCFPRLAGLFHPLTSGPSAPACSPILTKRGALPTYGSASSPAVGLAPTLRDGHAPTWHIKTPSVASSSLTITTAQRQRP